MTIAFKPAAFSRELASARLRAYLPCEYLKAAGWDCEIFDPALADSYRAVVFQKSYSEDDIMLAARLRQRGAATIFDLCDNHFFNPEDRPVFRERADRLRRMLDTVDAVTVSTPQIGALVGRPASVIDDALDPILPDRLVMARRAWTRIRRGPLRLVWFGSAGLSYPPSGLIDLAGILPELAQVNAKHPLRLTVISDSKQRTEELALAAKFQIRYREYNSKTIQHALRDHDLCIIPVGENPFTICKTVNRPALALQLGVPVIADVIPSYEEIRPYIGVSDWGRNIEAFLQYRAATMAKADNGAEYLQIKYTPDRVVRQWSAALLPYVAKPATRAA